MPRVTGYKRKRTKKPSVYRKRRRFNMTKRKFGKTGFFRLMRWSNADGTNNCHVTIDPLTLGSSGNYTTVFQLAHLAGNSEIVSLFDNYRITRVQYRWICTRSPDYPGVVGIAGLQGLYPRITWVHDFNDATAITRTQMMQHASLKEHFFNDNKQATRWYTLKPSSLTMKYETAALTAYKPEWGSWVDTADSQMWHYGIKYAYSDLQQGIILRLEAKVTIECKGIS